MIGTIRKHQQWLWMVIITVTIISFVVFFAPDAKWNGFSRDNRAYIHNKPVTINGEAITQDEFVPALRETILASFMRTGGREWPANDESTQERLRMDAVYRVFLIKKMRDMDVHISDAAIAQAAHDRLGGFALASFEREYLQPKGLTVEDFERFLKNELGIQQLISAAAVSAKLYSPREGEALYRKQHEQNDTRLAVFWASNFLDKVTVNPEELGKFFTNRQSAYWLRERAVVKYVQFPATNFLAEADKQIEKITNFNARVEEMYFKRGTNAFKGTNGVVLSEADAKKQIKDDIRNQYALLEGRRKASEFGNDMMNIQPEKAENLDKQAAAMNMVVKTSPPLERQGNEDEKDFPPEFRERAFKLTPAMPISYSPILSDEAVYIVALQTNLPAQPQPFEKVKDKVTADFKNAKAMEMAQNGASSFYTTLTNRLAQKESFDAICTQAKVQTITPPRFSTATGSLTNLDERISFNTLQQIAGDLKPGQVSRYTPTPMRMPEGGFIVYLKDRVPVDEATVKQELPEFLARMRTYRQNEVFNQWFRKQVEQSKLIIAPANASMSSGG